MENYIILHGSFGSPYSNWFPWLHGALSRRNKKATSISLPTPEGQNYNDWSKVFDAYIKVGYINENTTLFTHSMSCMFIVKYCIENHFKIKRAVLVCGFNNIDFNDGNDIYNTFYLEEEKLTEFIPLCEDRICLYSNNDPYVPMSKGEEFADNINAKKVYIENGGHLNKDSGYTEFRQLLEYL